MIELNDLTPLLISGMGRSGTSLLAKILKNEGIFIGDNLNNDYESLFFMKINEWIFYQTGSFWDNPTNFLNLYKNPEEFDLMFKYVSSYLKSSLWSFFGLEKNKISSHKQLSLLNWGWKDPRNVYTSLLWKKIFPNLKVIYIIRNGVDVANSIVEKHQKLEKREKIELEKIIENNFEKEFLKLGIFSNRWPEFYLNCNDYYSAFNLWELYIETANKMLKNFSSNNFIKIRYEDLIFDPVNKIHEILEFTSINKNKNELAYLENLVSKSRAYAFKNEPLLQNFYNDVKEIVNSISPYNI